MASPDAAAVQTVKLKILYTFDNDSKDNHLARWPQSVQVNTCFIDNVNQIGVVDLRTCLEAVTTASPELSSQIDTDYAVYAYDYSEEDTPLVGQGMLSKHMMEAFGQDTEAMVTGRIAKGLMGLLNKNAQPTLEVKLRLKPVAKAISRQRSGSMSSQDGRPAWLQNPEAILQRSASPMDTSGLENMQRMLSEGGMPRNDTYPQSRPGSRAGTPVYHPQYDQSQRPMFDDQARPSSRAAIQQPHHRHDSFSGYYSADDMMDEAPAPKRAKITKVKQATKDSFNIEQQPQDLRAMAGKANSLRLHRPTPVHPSGLPSNVFANEEPVRPPTPVPTKRPRGRPKNLGRIEKPILPVLNPAIANNARELLPMPQPSSRFDMSDARMSPEDVRARSVSSTPANIPSSPPIMPTIAARTSPTLPPMRDSLDSGLGSSNLDDDIFGHNGMVNFEDFDFSKAGEMPLDLDFDQFTEKQFPPVFDDVQDTPLQTDYVHDGANASSAEQILPTTETAERMLAPPKNAARSQSLTPAAAAGNDGVSPHSSGASLQGTAQADPAQTVKAARAPNKRTMSTIAASDPVGPTLQRSQTWAPGSDAPMSEAPSGQAEGDGSRTRTRKKLGKEQTKARLINAINSGDMPPYCDNCGAIETPAWRRGFAKVFDTDYGPVVVGLGPNEICYKHPLEHNADGSVKTWRGYKVDTNAQDTANGWTAICLCNPCGLWFHKQKCPRPKDKWEKAAKGRRRRGRPPVKRVTKTIPTAKSDAPTPASDESSPADTSTEAPDGEDNDEDMQGMDNSQADSNEPQLPPMPRHMRASSVGPGTRAVNNRAALSQRQIQSSPTKGAEHTDDQAEADLTPKPLRRQLFPSPNKSLGAPFSAHGSSEKLKAGLMAVRRSPRITKTKDVFQVPGIAGAVALTVDGKENIMPDAALIEDSVFAEFFNSDMHDPEPEPEAMPPPSTPHRRSERLMSKTPQRSFGDQLSDNVRRSPHDRTPLPKQTADAITRALLGSVAKNPEDMTPMTREVHNAIYGNHPIETLTPNRLRRPPPRSPNKNVTFDFPDVPALPSLSGSSPSVRNDDPHFSVDFSELPTDILQTDMTMPFSTDAPMPSSPPGGFDSMDFSIHHDSTFDDWGQLHEEHGGKTTYPDPTDMGNNVPMTPRRSARKREL